ncbi:hypothetical protein NZNM25_18650 [Nitrosopumilus zosterae]|uniref:AAA+ ATPase domain-containing protein n=1 Tax=Nitrosopumilus zosterae TaxID=718286 RepID=A0A2S2KTU7_9ARCH|nr:MoxR family ATPase [Nitrosopumilus zosterae]BDQ31727.1 MoxR family ATPase [Nitrosopumilus zosterae]GBH35074.1 hypothetical protein NZNM25_18650 [Nitrosopumilus zosterae]
MAEVSTTKNFRAFLHHLDREINATKPYRYLVIEALLNSYPNPLLKKNISDYLRNNLKTNEPFEHYNIWSQLTDKDELIVETENGFKLNIENISNNEKNSLLKICMKRISNVDTDYKQNLKQPQAFSTPSINNYNLTQPDRNISRIGYYLVRFRNNSIRYGDFTKLDKIQKHSLNLSRNKMKHFKINDNNRNLAILYDTKASQIRIWGRAEMVQKSQFSHTTPNITFKNFEPLLQKDGIIIPKWLLQHDKRESMFGNKPILVINKNDFDRILNSAVEQEDLFPTDNTSDSDQSRKTNIENSKDGKAVTSESQMNDSTANVFEDGDGNEFIEQIKHLENIPLEIPNKEVLENGIKEIQKSLLIDSKTIKEIVIHLTSGRNILLAGPVGTGKTHLSKLIPKIFWQKEGKGFDVKVYTASNEWNVSDVIGGIVPRMQNGKPIVKIQRGCVTDTIKRNWDNKIFGNQSPFRGTWLIIDEFNRADIDKSFGQLFTSLESKVLRVLDDKNPTLIEMQIPLDYRIIGTLNTSDKHYLFKLSDALKRRFAYIEVKTPLRKDAEHEIYFALSRALDELPSDVSSLIQLNSNEEKVSNEQSNNQLYLAIRSAYEILSFVRIIKDMGTAILKSIYQSMLIGTQISGYDNSILDISLCGIIIPQLEKIEATNIEVLLQFCFDDVHSFFHRKYDGTDDEDRQKYVEEFEFYLKYLQISEIEKLKQGFSRKNLSKENWDRILDKWRIQKSKNQIPKDLPLFRDALKELKKTFEFL